MVKKAVVPQEGEKDEGVSTIGVAKQDVMRLQAPDDCTSISVRGMEFEVPESGLVDVPVDIGADLLSHGFTRVQAKAEEVKAARRRVQPE